MKNPVQISVNADCLEAMRHMLPKTFDVAVCDPPYFSGPEKRGYYGKEVSSQNVKRRNYPITETWELPTQEWFEQVQRVAKNWIIWGANYYDFLGPIFKTPRRNEIDQWIKDNPTGWVIWDKVNDGVDFNTFELARTSFNGPTKVFPFLWRGMMQGKSIEMGSIQQGDKSKNEAKIHPTQKPVLLYKWLFNEFIVPGQTVLDTHLGSGSSMIAAYDMGIPILGFELSETHFKNQQKRFLAHTAQGRLFTP